MAVRPIPCSGGVPVPSQIFAEFGDDQFGTVAVTHDDDEIVIGAALATPSGAASWTLAGVEGDVAFVLNMNGVEVLRFTQHGVDPAEVAFFGVPGSARPAFTNDGTEAERISNLEDALDGFGLIELLD